MVSGTIEAKRLHDGLRLVGQIIKDYRILGVAEIKNNIIKFDCEHTLCNGTKRQIWHTELSSKKRPVVYCASCNPRGEPYSKAGNRLYPFYKLYRNVYSNGKRSKDFKDFETFFIAAVVALGGDFDYNLNLALKRYTNSEVHSFTNSFLVLSRPDGTQTEYNFMESNPRYKDAA